MIMNIYAIRDTKSGFLSPTLDVSHEVSRRNFEHAFMVASGESLFFTHAEDYSLYCLGSYDTESGVITPNVVPEFIMNAPRKE
ncbi:nonstructural protein [Dipodfec virus RodF1_63]|uniref:Nonstructural protein n=1 Tax=Dipodfec virus RodF1_63 TaxID=2929305 RepID=A0A976N376_9VIRU|nr:nonstructural protein [Dipodfec virus RodF1_63]